MATSGTYTFSVTRNEIIRDALALLGVYGVGLPVQVEDQNLAVSFLNKMVKAWQMQGLHLWKRQEGALFLTQYVGQYDIGGTATGRAADLDDCVITDNTTAVASGANTVVCRTVTGMATSDVIGLVNENYVTEWFTISSINTGTKTVTLSSTLSAAVPVNSNVYSYSSLISKPTRLLTTRRVTGYDAITTSTLLSIDMGLMAYDDFQQLPNKALNGEVPVNVCFTPYNLFGRIEVWPRPSKTNVYITFTYEQMIEDWTNAGDNPDFPIEWSEALTYGLAVRMAPIYGKEDKLQALLPMAQTMLGQILDADADNTSIFIKPR